MKIGFTGTQKGMTKEQLKTIEEFYFWPFRKVTKIEFHHGCCIGADYEMHNFARKLGLYIVLHPPLKTIKMADCPCYNERRRPKDYLARNRDIVNESEIMIATPKLFLEEWRSGTWAAIRYTRKKKKPLIIVWPNGNILNERVPYLAPKTLDLY